MADNNLLSRVRNSKFYRSVSNALDRDKDQPGFQFTSPGIRNTANQARSNFTGNVRAIANPQTRRDWSVGAYGKLMDVTGSTALQRRQDLIDKRNKNKNLFERITRPTQQDERKLLGQGIQGGAKTIGTIMLPAYKGLALANAGLGYGLSRLGGANNKQALGSAVEAAQYAPIIGQFAKATNPIINKQLSKLPVKTPQFIQNRIAPTFANVAQGIGMDAATGRPTDALSLGLDAAVGFAGGKGQFSTVRPNAKGLKTNTAKIFRPDDVTSLDRAVDVLRTEGLDSLNGKKARKVLDTLADAYLTKSEIDKIWNGKASQKSKLNQVAKALQKKASNAAGDTSYYDYALGLVGGQKATGYKNAAKFSSRLDQKPRFEIDDSGAKLTKAAAERNFYYPDVKKGVLSEYIDHPKLFEQYPQLKDAKVSFVRTSDVMGDGSRAAYDPKTNRITVNTDWINRAKNEDVKSTLLHEIQHAIQEIEGFARGGNTNQFMDVNRINIEMNDLATKGLGGGRLTPKEQRLLSLYEDMKAGKVGPTEGYKRLSGELEARAVQRRMDMPVSQRLRTDPYAAEAIATTGRTDPNDFITRFDGGTQASQPTKGVEPQEFYHGTNATPEQLSKGFKVQEEGIFGKGVYVSDSPEFTKSYGKNIIPTKVNIKKVWDFSTPEQNKQWQKWIQDGKDKGLSFPQKYASKQVQKLGFDAIQTKEFNATTNKEIKNLVVFNPKNVSTTPSIQPTKGVEPLIEEARKYKSADDFTNAVLGGKISPKKLREMGFKVKEGTRLMPGAIELPKGFSDFDEIYKQSVKNEIITPKTRVDSQDIQTDKPLNTLTKEQVQKARSRLIRTQTSEAKGQTFQTGEPVRGGSKIRTQASEKVGAGSQGPSSPVSITRDNKYSFNINKKRLNLDEEQSRQLDDVVRVMRPVLEKNKGKTLTKQEIIEAGRKADVLRDTVGREESKQFAESLQASRNLLRSQQSQVGITPEFLDQLEVVSSVAADAGRRLQAFNIGAEDITVKEKVLRDLINIGASVDEMLEAGRKVDWDNAEEVTRFYRKFKPATLADKLDEFRYTNMLSSPNTHIVNTFSNFLQTAVLAPIEKTIRGTISFAEARLTGKEQEYFARQGVDYANGYWKSLPDAWESFNKTLSGSGSLTKLETNRIPTSTSTIRKWYTTPLRLLEASDQFFRTMTKAGETESLKRQGITGARAAKMAEAEADYRTFRQAFDPNGDLGQNKVLQIWDKWNTAISNLRNVPGGKWIVPFLQTPTNILKQGVEYSPLGFATAPGAREPMTQLSKAIVGSTVFTGAYALANSGLTTWDAPTNSNERAEFYAAGLQPYSVKIGDKWVSYSKLGPLSYPIAMAAALKWAEENGADEGLLSQVGMTIGGTLGFFADQSYVRGIGDVIDAVRGDDYKRARGLANIPSQLVPYRAFMGWLARMVDPVYRKSSGGTVQAQIGKNIISQIPFASKTLPAYETPFGGESERQFAVANNFSPLAVTQERPEEKEYYDARQVVRDEDKKLDKILTKIENGETDNLPKTDKNKILTDKAIEITKKKVEAGIEVTPEELNVAYIGKALTMPSGNRYERSLRQSAMYEALGRIEDNEDLSDGQKQLLKAKIATEVGKTPEDIEMYSVAKQNVDTKTLYALDQIDNMQSTDELMTYLVRGRMPINGQVLTSDGVLNNLVNEGIISKQLASDLKKLDFNEDGTLKKKVSSGGSKKNNLTTARLKAKVDSIKAFRQAQKRYFDNIMSVDPYQGSVPITPPKIDISRIKSIA